jgi:hypothetical protein
MVGPSFPQRRMVTYYRERRDMYLRMAEKTSRPDVREFSLNQACDYDHFATVEERAILRGT